MKKIAILFTIGLFFFIAYQLVGAQRLESENYVITFGNFNVTSGEKSSTNYNVTDTVGQTGSGPYGQYGSSAYFVGSGFQYIYQINAFSFQISKNLIDLGELIEDTHNTDSHTLTITTKGAGGYSVYAYEEYPLSQIQGTAEIPNTTCDAGSCTHITAGVWTNQSIPGFGYNMSGNDIPAGFVNSTYFKSFANRVAAQEMQIVMSSDNVADARQSTVTYKAGIEGSQANGIYETAVVFVAVPGY